jgi:hypothetical protein
MYDNYGELIKSCLFNLQFRHNLLGKFFKKILTSDLKLEEILYNIIIVLALKDNEC